MKIVQVGEFACKIGANAQENWDLIDKAKRHHWFFHLTDFASPYVVLECEKTEPNAHIKERCAGLCVEHSKYKHNKKMKVDATPCGNVKVDKKDEVGECDYKNEGKVEVIVVQGNRGGGSGGAAASQQQSEVEDAPTLAADSADRGQPKKATEGKHLVVRKTNAGGSAILSFKDPAVRKTILRERTEVMAKSGVRVKLQPQLDPSTKEEVLDGIFASWGQKTEGKTPVSEAELLRCFEALAGAACEAMERTAPARATSERVQVRKAAVGGCAVVSFAETTIRDAILALGAEITVGEVTAKMQPQRDPKTREEVPNAIFVAWGRKVEEKTPVSETELLRSFEELHDRVGGPAGVESAQEKTSAAPDGRESDEVDLQPKGKSGEQELLG